MTESIARVSIHGAHSGEFCAHATDRLEAVIQRYIELGFQWAGITEHMPPVEERFVYPEEKEMGLTPEDHWKRFSAYIQEARRLQKHYADRITLYVGMETEGYSHAEAAIHRAISLFHPDYLVGSIHHVADSQIDGDALSYWRLAERLGGIDSLYARYFDRQYELIFNVSPKVVGHFDLIRIFDPDYPARWKVPAIWDRVERNLRLIRDRGMILDFNARALFKGAIEPYVSAPVLSRALELGIPAVPGDDSHGVTTAGMNVDKAIDILKRSGFDTRWKTPN